MASIETILDHIAYTLNKEPLEVRKINMSTKKHPDIISKYLNGFLSWANVEKRKADIDAFNKVKLRINY